MKLHVGVGIFFQIGAHRIAAVLHREFPQRLQFGVAGIFRGQPGCHAFQRSPGHDHFQNLFARFAADEDAFARHDLDQPLLRQPGQRLSDRGARNAKTLRQLPLVQPQVGIGAVNVHVQNGGAQHVEGMILQSEAVSYRAKLVADRHEFIPPQRSTAMISDSASQVVLWYTIHRSM